MKRVHTLPILPEEQILLIDSCAFGALKSNKIYNYTIPEVKKELSRLNALTERLSKMDNWTTTNAVIEEFKLGNERFGRAAKSKFLKCRQLNSVFSRLKNQREKTLELLNDSYRIINGNLQPVLEEKINELYPTVKKVFREFEKYQKRETDTELISSALVFAIDEPVCIFSCDENLIKTYIKCARQMKIYYNVHVVNDKTTKAMNILYY